MYFNHAFRKGFLPVKTPKQGGGFEIALASSGTTASLTAGQIGFFDTKLFQPVALASAKPFILAQGSYFTSDVIGGNRFLGGYQESVKSKIINPKYISRLIKVSAVAPVTQIKEVCVCNLECGKTYRLRLDLKGSPALRFLSHNIYKTLDAFTGCCTDDCSATCTGALVDPTVVVINWAKQIVTSPTLIPMIKVTVKDFNDDTVAVQAGTSVTEIADFIAALDDYSPNPAWDPAAVGASALQACLSIEVAFEETKFANCTFTPTDFYELMPLKVIPSVTDETGDPCNVQCVTISGENGVPEVRVPRQASGVGETVLRELILDGRYLQNAYPDSTRVESLRMREIEADPALATINRYGANSLYDQVLILHNVPRFNNPTSTFDNDQYLLKLHVPAGTDVSQITNFIEDACDLAQGAGVVTLEQY